MALRDYFPIFAQRAERSKFKGRKVKWVSAVSSGYLKETRNLAGGALGGTLGASMGIDAGAVGRKEASWPTYPMTADQIIWQFKTTMVARSRECANNNDHGRRYMHLVRDNIVGANGVRLKPIPRGADGKYDEETADCISEAYATFCESPEVTGQHDMVTDDRSRITTAAQDGDILTKLVYGKDAGPYGFALQNLDPFLLDPHYNEDGLPGGVYIRASIEYNAAGRPLAYHLRKGQNDYWGYASTTDYQRVPADEIIHSFLPELPGQKQGMPWMRTALMRLWHLKGFETACVINARVSAAKCGFFRDPDGEADDTDPLEMDAEPGTFEDIGNREFIKVDWNWPTGEFDPFLKAALRHAAAGLNVAYHSLTGDMTGASYSGIRVPLLDEREGWMALQVWYACSHKRREYRAWLEYALLAGKIVDKKGKPLPAQNIDNYKRVVWLGRRWAWIDPLKEVSANIQAIIHRLRSRTQVIEEQGGDATTTFEQIQAEEAELKELGVSLPVQAGGQQTPNTVNVGPDANANDEVDDGADPDTARANELAVEIGQLRALNRANAAVIAESEMEVARLRAAGKAKSKSRKK